jgi:hypothetical protein
VNAGFRDSMKKNKHSIKISIIIILILYCSFFINGFTYRSVNGDLHLIKDNGYRALAVILSIAAFSGLWLLLLLPYAIYIKPKLTIFNITSPLYISIAISPASALIFRSKINSFISSPSIILFLSLSFIWGYYYLRQLTDKKEVKIKSLEPVIGDEINETQEP